MTTSVIIKSEVRRFREPPPWDVVERYTRAGEHQEWIEVYGEAVPAFADDVALRSRTERPPWALVERYLTHGEHGAWVEWYAGAVPAFAALLVARRAGRRPPWALVDAYVKSGEYREWVESYAQTSRAFAEVLATTQNHDDDDQDYPPVSEGAVVISLRDRGRGRRG